MDRFPACNKTIGSNLAYRRGLLGYSQKRIADALELARPTISAIEHGRQALTFAQAIVLHEKLGITFGHLAHGTPIAY